MSNDKIHKPCEYCGVNLPLGVSKETRRSRSFHFSNCEKRLQITAPSPDIEAQSDALLAEVERLTRERDEARAEVERLREALRDALDGLRYWVPQTSAGAVERSRIMEKGIEALEGRP